MTINKNVGKGSFDLALSEISDPDNAIVKYTYEIYAAEDLTEDFIVIQKGKKVFLKVIFK